MSLDVLQQHRRQKLSQNNTALVSDIVKSWGNYNYLFKTAHDKFRLKVVSVSYQILQRGRWRWTLGTKWCFYRDIYPSSFWHRSLLTNMSRHIRIIRKLRHKVSHSLDPFGNKTFYTTTLAAVIMEGKRNRCLVLSNKLCLVLGSVLVRKYVNKNKGWQFFQSLCSS